MRVFIGMETSGQIRRRLVNLGHQVISCDILPPDDDVPSLALSSLASVSGVGLHVVGDVFAALDALKALGWWPDAAIFHPECTYLTNSAAWAYKDADFSRYPGVGYHQKVRPGTRLGADRRAARDRAVRDWERIDELPISKKIAENPAYGALSSRFRPPDQVVQPYYCGDDASKATGFWLWGLRKINLDPRKRLAGRVVEWPRGSGKMVERWGNQTDSGQNRLTPGEDRWKDRSRTYDGVADVLAAHIHASRSDE